MYKNRSKYDYGSIIIRYNRLPHFRCYAKEVTLHHHKPISEEEMQSLEKLGYNKHEIWKAAHIARMSKKIKDVLAYYKQNKSWEKTAEHFG